ncbi:MAG: hypothetical protein B7Y03_07225 [Polaromonas sp. 24-62-144]|uniref:sensor histidine kinase n=1 Tax=Polaromonas sp. TaxID=1869339 RepID=UPI000BDDCB17|nr:ATP-binding protein [Polaromonas sp.]OYY52391.1 MAG: hypothetical protein B7Y54_07155 [Polaromonas sp. 35-63-240]OYZ83800.1 MAG: hypothetical protein B7Y03_07225 [Polaromonas sp. 24-62-144]HQS90726.1 ATP-binding protein [Polaromonas sp.]
MPSTDPSTRPAASGGKLHSSINITGKSRRQRSFWSRILRAAGIARLAWLTCALSIVALSSVTFTGHEADKKRFSKELDTAVTLEAKGYAKFVSLNLASVDRELKAMRLQVLDGRRLPTQAAMNSRLGELSGLVLQVAVANADGQIVDSSLTAPNPPVSIADRPHFLAFKNNPTERLFISEPVLGRVSKKPSLQLVRPMFALDGAFAGVIVASIDPELLKSYFTDMKALEDQGRVSIVGLDGVIRFDLTKRGFTTGRDVHTSPNWDQLSTLTTGLFQEDSLGDKVYRRTGFHRVEGYPLVVMVGTGLQERMAQFVARWKLIWGLTLALALVLIVVAGTIARLAKEQKRSYLLLQKNRQQELESNRTKSSFLASVSHELRTPLNSILGFSELIRDTNEDPRTSQYAGLIHKSGTQLHALVNTILDLTKIESGKMGLVLENIDMVELLSTLTSIHKVSADQKHVELSLALDGVTQGVVVSDRTKLTQVLNNVIHNAIKFTPAGVIFVVMKPAGEAGLQISVVDSGIGISAEHIGQVFGRFNTIGAHIDSGAEKGTGLGLALCRELLNLMGGTIGLVSEPDQGTTVDIFIPYNIPKEGNAR